jgi:hypothetical protein
LGSGLFFNQGLNLGLIFFSPYTWWVLRENKKKGISKPLWKACLGWALCFLKHPPK